LELIVASLSYLPPPFSIDLSFGKKIIIIERNSSARKRVILCYSQSKKMEVTANRLDIVDLGYVNFYSADNDSVG
jgi:hypothetical protein